MSGWNSGDADAFNSGEASGWNGESNGAGTYTLILLSSSGRRVGSPALFREASSSPAGTGKDNI
jgi:hypothetical protein